MQPQYGAVKLRCLLAIAIKPGIIKLNLYEVLESSKQVPLLVLIDVNDLDSNTAML